MCCAEAAMPSCTCTQAHMPQAERFPRSCAGLVSHSPEPWCRRCQSLQPKCSVLRSSTGHDALCCKRTAGTLSTASTTCSSSPVRRRCCDCARLGIGTVIDHSQTPPTLHRSSCTPALFTLPTGVHLCCADVCCATKYAGLLLGLAAANPNSPAAVCAATRLV